MQDICYPKLTVIMHIISTCLLSFLKELLQFRTDIPKFSAAATKSRRAFEKLEINIDLQSL